MKTAAELHEARLLETIANCRKLLLTLQLFALAIVGAGAVRLNQAQMIKSEARELDKALPADWEPLESFYDRSGQILANFADDHSTPWSRGYMLISIYFIALEQLKPNPTIAGTIERVGDLGRNLHRYNSDVRTVAAAQRRNLSFRELSRRELEAVERIASHRFTSQQKETLEDTPKFAKVILGMSAQLQAQSNPKNNGVLTILQLKSSVSRDILQKLIDDDKWSEAEADLLSSDLYYSNGKGDEKEFAALRKSIQVLPAQTIAAAEERRANLKSQQAALMLDAGLSIPLLGVRVAAAHVSLASGIINALLIGTLCSLLYKSRLELRALKAAAPDQEPAARMLMVRDASYHPREFGRAALFAAALFAPTAAALVLFGADALRPIVLTVSIGVLALVIAFATIAVWAAGSLARSAEPAVQPISEASA